MKTGFLSAALLSSVFGVSVLVAEATAQTSPPNPAQSQESDEPDAEEASSEDADAEESATTTDAEASDGQGSDAANAQPQTTAQTSAPEANAAASGVSSILPNLSEAVISQAGGIRVGP